MGIVSEYTRQAPLLVDLSKFKAGNGTEIQLFPKKKRKWSINKILLVGFAIFTIFFLYNCRYGIFKQKEPSVVPYTVSTQNKN